MLTLLLFAKGSSVPHSSNERRRFDRPRFAALLIDVIFYLQLAKLHQKHQCITEALFIYDIVMCSVNVMLLINYTAQRLLWLDVGSALFFIFDIELREHMIMESDTGDFPLMFVICQSLRWTHRRSIISAVAHLEHQDGTKAPCDNMWSSHNYKSTGDNTKLCLCHHFALLISDLLLIMQIKQCNNFKFGYWIYV